MVSEVGVVTAVTSAIVGAVVSVVVVVVLLVVVVSVVDSSLSSPQEMTERLKQEISKMNNPFFIFSSIPIVKYYCFVFGEHYLYHQSV